MTTEIAPGITVDPGIHHGRPVIQGTRIPVEIVIGNMAGGLSAEEVASEYGITLEDVRAALSYAAEMLAGEEFRAVN